MKVLLQALSRRRRLRESSLIAVVVFLVLGVPCLRSAQPAISGKVSGGFQAPTSTDAQGRRSVLKGESMEQRGNDIVEITKPRVVNYNADDTPDMYIDAPRGSYDTKSSVAWGDSTLTVRTADERFSIEGVGWRWVPSGSLLLISNQVTAVVRKSALATNVAPASPTNAIENIQIHSTGFRQEGDAISFIQDVRVLDGTNTLACDRLNLELIKPGGLQKIDAFGNVHVSQNGTEVVSGRAHYDLKENIVRFTEKPKWSQNRREGSADLLLIYRTNDTVYAESSVYMKLPMTNVIANSTAPAPDKIAAPGTNRFIEIYSGKFKYRNADSNRLAQAVYEDHVRVKQDEAIITSARLMVDFDAESRMEHVRAEGDVVIENGPNKAFGDVAEYELAADRIVLTGQPRWTLGERTGSSRRLIFLTKTKETLALEDVKMLLPGRSMGNMFTLNAPAGNAAASNEAGKEFKSPMSIGADSFSHSENTSVFQGTVQAKDNRGSIDCDLLTIITGLSNRVERIVAENNVVIRQPNTAAFGDRADYDASNEIVRLTGNPELIMPDKTLHAEAFLIDRRNNTFSVAPGKYRIELQAKNSRPERRGNAE
jgi:lipopolysaccharide export system protein LptA